MKVESSVRRTTWALGFAMMVFGLLVTTQMRVQKQVPLDANRLRSDELVQQLKATEEQLRTTIAERDRLAGEADKLRKASSGTVVPVPQVDPYLQLLAGSVATQGSGIVITVTEAPEAANKTRVRDEDLWLITNELLAAGAEGISINDQRLVGVSGIRNVGTRVMIYQTMTNSPFQISAIGEPAVMETALRMRGGVVDTLGRWGIKVSIIRSDAVKLPAFRGAPSFRYSKPLN